MRLRDVMNPRVVTIESRESANAAWSRMRRHRIRHLVVTKKGQLAGVISERDLGGVQGKSIRKGRSVQSLMSPRVISAPPTMTLREAANLMRQRAIGSLPVLQNEQVVGIVTATDVLDELGRSSMRPLRMSSRNVARVPVHIRSAEGDLSTDDRDYIRRKLERRLGKFADSIERVSVRTEDVNGPRGGVDRVCRIKVVLKGLPSVVFESRHASLQASVNLALAGIERAVRRSVQRRRMAPLRRAA